MVIELYTGCLSVAVASHHATDMVSIAARLKVLTEPNRLRIIDLLMQGVQCNCELGTSLAMPPNLISHHLSVLRESGLVTAERDPVDARWIYYSINRESLAELVGPFSAFFDPERIQPRRPNCGPRGASDAALPDAKHRGACC